MDENLKLKETASSLTLINGRPLINYTIEQIEKIEEDRDSSIENSFKDELNTEIYNSVQVNSDANYTENKLQFPLKTEEESMPINNSQQLEKKIVEKITNNGVLIAFCVLTLMAIWIRFSVKDFESADYKGFLVPWYGHFKTHGGFAALKSPIGDYNIPYQFLIAWMSYIKLRPLYLYKILSCIFDFLLAVYSGKFVYYISSERTGKSCSFKGAISDWTFVLPYGVVLLLPTVVLNSALWAQCDAIYTFFIVFLYLFYILLID